MYIRQRNTKFVYYLLKKRRLLYAKTENKKNDERTLKLTKNKKQMTKIIAHSAISKNCRKKKKKITLKDIS